MAETKKSKRKIWYTCKSDTGTSTPEIKTMGNWKPGKTGRTKK